MDKHNAQEVQEPARAPEVLKLTAAAMRRDVRALDIFASVLDQPENVQLDAFIEKLAEYAQEAQEPTGEQLAFSLPDYNPELDPAGAAFDPAAYRQAIAEAGGWQSFKTDLRDEMRDIYGNLAEMGRAAAAAFKNSPGAKAAANLANNPGLKAATERALQQAAILQKALRDFWESPEMKRSRESLAEVIKNVEAIAAEQKAKAAEQWPEYADAPEQIQEIAVYIQAELTDAEAEGRGLEGATLSDIMAASFTEEWEPIKTSPYYDNVVFRAMERARGRAEGLQWAETLARSEEPEAEELAKAITKEVNALIIPMDRANAFELWDANKWREREAEGTQLVFDVWTEREEGAAKVDFVYSVDFEALDGVKLSKPFTQYDKRVYIASAGVYNAGGDITSIRQIYKAMGNTGDPGKTQRQKIADSLDKMAATTITVNNAAELDAFKDDPHRKGHKIPEIKYTGQLLPMERVTAIINGKEADAIHLFREPPLISFAKAREQMTTISRDLLESPQNKTDHVIAIQDYLIYQISLKAGGRKKKLAYSTIFEKCGITSRTSQRNAPEKIKTELEHYKKQGLIVDFREYIANGKPAGVEITRAEEPAKVEK